VLELLISTACGRFPRALLEPPCASHYGVSRLMLFPQESPPSVRINDAVLRIMNKLKRLWNWPGVKKDAVNDNDNVSQQMEYARLLGEMRSRWDPGVRQHEEAHQPPPESEYIPFAVIEGRIFREVPAESVVYFRSGSGILLRSSL